MFSTQYICLLVGLMVFVLILAYGKTLRYGKKFHRPVFAAKVLEGVGVICFVFVMGWHTASLWRPILLIAIFVVWLAATNWSRRLREAQSKIPYRRSRRQSA